MAPDAFDGQQATRFQPGTRHAVLTVSVPASVKEVHWRVLGVYGIARRDTSGRCPSSTPLSADGNGLGMVIALVASGAAAGGWARVGRRRRERGAEVAVAASAG
jgi:hypothetical protein